MVLRFSPSTGLSRLMNGADSVTGETFLFRIQRVGEHKGADTVYYLVKDEGFSAGAGERMSGPLTFEGACAVARARIDTYNKQTNFGAF